MLIFAGNCAVMIRQFSKKYFRNFFKSSSSGSAVLFICLVASLLIANSPIGDEFIALLNTELGMETETIHLRYPVILWINDGLMAIFFLMVGLELKRELVEGELSSFKQAVLPIVAATGGAVLPALIYTAFNAGETTASGWGIPMATDIAFALAAINLLGKRVPSSLKIFIAALAIVDDLMAILVIAFFYSAELHLSNLLYAGGIFALLVVFNRLGVKNLLAYLIPGVLIWYFIHHSGIHATIAGVLTAMTVPTNKGSNESPLEKLEHALAKPVSFIIIPLFALANTNIRFESAMVEGLYTSMGLGIILGLFIGKPVGILLMTWISVKLKLCVLPNAARWGHILGVGFLAGIGFTMSIFIALLSFDEPLLQAEAKFSILVGSVISGLTGYFLLNTLRRKKI